jgi:pimeloyl-ACP methyl ester carboxylesterase
VIEPRIISTEARGAALVDDLRFDGPDGLEVEAYLVRAAATTVPGASPEPAALRGTEPDARGAGILMWHWLDDQAPDGDRTQFLDEAADLAARGAVCLLPQGRFPWTTPPTGAAADSAAILAEVGRLRAGLDLLAARPEVDPARLAVVGHDFGGMLAAIEAADDDRLRALVLVAATPRWGDWFLAFWPIEEDRIDYLRLMRPLDPIEVIARAGPAEILFQYGRSDFYIAAMSGLEFHGAAPSASELLAYDTGHDMRLPEIRADRAAFLARTLRLAKR